MRNLAKKLPKMLLKTHVIEISVLVANFLAKIATKFATFRYHDFSHGIVTYSCVIKSNTFMSQLLVLHDPVIISR